MKTILVLIYFLLSIPVVAANDSLFRSVDDQFRFLYPETWIVKKGQGANVKAKVVADDGSSCNIVVRRLPSDIAHTPNNQAMDELSAVDLLDMIQVKWPDAVLLEGGKTHIDNRVALYGYSDLTHNVFNANVKVRQLSVFITEYGKAYLITCMARVELFPKHKSTFEKIVRSFVFEY